MSNRTLLPPWSEYKMSLNIDAKEPFETFDWMDNQSDASDLKIVKDVLDATPGAREYLRDYPEPVRNKSSFSDPFGLKLLSTFDIHKTGVSVILLARMYQNAMNNWEEFVLAQKTSYAKIDYEKSQLAMEDLWKYGNTRTMVSPHQVNPTLLNEYRIKYNIKYDNDTMIRIFDKILKEQAAERLEKQRERDNDIFKEQIHVLEQHYEHPSRWKDSPYGSLLLGSPKNITPDMFLEMENKYPNYRAHIARVIKGIQ